KAAQGFARSKGISPDDLYVEDVKGTDYLFAEVKTKGKQVAEILPQTAKIIEEMNFPVNMRWANHSFRYLRPVHWIVALLDDKVVPLTALGVESGRKTRGHRFL